MEFNHKVLCFKSRRCAKLEPSDGYTVLRLLGNESWVRSEFQGLRDKYMQVTA